MSRTGPSPHVPLFSVLLPTHDRADVLPFAIRSALWQTQPDFELLIAGDGCTDGTADVVASFDDPRIRWFDLPKAPGIGYANRNRVLREARGKWIAYLAHDDLWFPDHLQRLEALLVETGAALAYSRGLMVATDGGILPYWYNAGVADHRRALAKGQAGVTMCSVVHERASLDRHGYWDETLRFVGDQELWHRMIAGEPDRPPVFLAEPTSLHFVANWRSTAFRRGVMRLVSGLVRGALADPPPSLRLPSDPARTQQQVAWERLATAPGERVREIRRDVVAFRDAILWNAERVPGLVGLAAGRVLGRGLAGSWRSARFVLSAGYRSTIRQLRSRTDRVKEGR